MPIEFFVDKEEDLFFPPLGAMVHQIVDEPPVNDCKQVAELVKANRFDVHNPKEPTIVLRYRNYSGNEWKESRCKR